MTARACMQLTMETIDKIGRLADVSHVEAHLRRALEGLGLHTFVLAKLPAQVRFSQAEFIVDITPTGLSETYKEEKLYENDYIARFLRRADRALDVRQIPYAPSEASEARRLLSTFASFGLAAGMVIPTVPVDGLPAGVAVFGNAEIDYAAIGLCIELLAMYVAQKTNTLMPRVSADHGYRLSSREREILNWTAQGKTTWEIGEINSISENVVNRHIAAAMSKLDAVTRTQAVATAIRLREIDP